MTDATRQRALRTVREAQEEFERRVANAHSVRQEAFAKAQREGLSLRDIGAEIGLDRSRIGQIIRGD